MPRIHPRIFQQARSINPLIEKLLPVCRDLRSAQLELRWLREHANCSEVSLQQIDRRLNQYVRRRSRGEPLQYILGSEFFGDLEIECRSGVLIPRQETAAAVSYLVSLLTKGSKQPSSLQVLDLCTGTGCIPLLFHHDYYAYGRIPETRLSLVGVDISSKALSLAKHNQRAQLRIQRGISRSARDSLASIQFVQADVRRRGTFSDCPIPPVLDALQQQHRPLGGSSEFDILISNPPYISSKDYMRVTARSVRDYEPKQALVPRSYDTEQNSAEQDGDIFYPRLLEIAEQVRAKIVLFEVADLTQATRVARMAVEGKRWEGIEIWRDHPSANGDSEEYVATSDSESESEIKILGKGNGRSVFLYRGKGTQWLGT